MPHLSMLNDQMRKCIELCTECSLSCTETITHCLEKGGHHAEREHITLLQLCADTCQLSARAMCFASPLHEHICDACAQVCEACAEDCEALADADEMMLRCAETCRACASSCKEMGSGGHRLSA